jgi:hypothetical protein
MLHGKSAISERSSNVAFLFIRYYALAASAKSAKKGGPNETSSIAFVCVAVPVGAVCVECKRPRVLRCGRGGAANIQLY